MKTNKNPSKIPQQFICNNCDYTTCNLKDYNKHILTQKHIRLINVQKSQNNNEMNFYSICGKVYKHKTSVYKHTKTCQKCVEQQQIKSQPITSELILNIIKDNNEMKQLLFEQNNRINEIITNGVIDSIKLKLTVLENVGNPVT
jgi:hypothetical protein